MNEYAILLLFLFSLSAWVPPSLNIYVTLLLLLLLAFFNRKKPDTATLILCFVLGVNYLVQYFFNIQDVDFEPQIAWSFFIIQNCILIGSALSGRPKKYSYNAPCKIKVYFVALNKLFLLVLVVIPLVKITFVLAAYGGLKFPNDLPSALGLLIFDDPSTVTSSNTYDSKTLLVFPRLILSKSSVSFLLIYTAAWFSATIKSDARLYLLLLSLAFISFGFRIAFFSILCLLVSSFLVRSGSAITFSEHKKTLKLLALPLINVFILFSFFSPFFMLLLDRPAVVRYFDRFPSFLAALNYSININVTGATFGSYWRYTDQYRSTLTRLYGENIGDVYLGTELFISELITSLGLLGAAIFSIYLIKRINQNAKTMIGNFDIIPVEQRHLVFLQIGLACASIGAAVNLIGISFFVIAGWKLIPRTSEEPLGIKG
jgi:hypothetical protein